MGANVAVAARATVADALNKQDELLTEIHERDADFLDVLGAQSPPAGGSDKEVPEPTNAVANLLHRVDGHTLRLRRHYEIQGYILDILRGL